MQRTLFSKSLKHSLNFFRDKKIGVRKLFKFRNFIKRNVIFQQNNELLRVQILREH